jgi:hypothetical protein
MPDETKTVTRQDQYGNDIEVPVGRDGENPVSPNNPAFKADPFRDDATDSAESEAPEEQDASEVEEPSEPETPEPTPEVEEPNEPEEENSAPEPVTGAWADNPPTEASDDTAANEAAGEQEPSA